MRQVREKRVFIIIHVTQEPAWGVQSEELDPQLKGRTESPF